MFKLNRSLFLIFILISQAQSELDQNSNPTDLSSAALQKECESNHYAPRRTLIGYPDYPLNPSEKSKLSTNQEILSSMRMVGEIDWPHTPEEAEIKAKSLQDRGYNIVRWGERYFLADSPDEELPSLLRGETLENKIKYAKIYIPALHRHGIKFLWQPTLPLVSKSYLQRHPSMATIDLRTGEIFKDAGYGTAMACAFNEELLNDLLQRMEKVLKEAGGDGVMFDDHQMFRIDHCGCSSCQEKYKKKTGKDLLKIIPPLILNGDRNHPDMVEWFKWRSDEVINTYLRARECVKKINPDLFICTYNNSNTVGAGYLAAGVCSTSQMKYADTIGMETEYPGNAYKYYWPLLIVESKFTRSVTEKAKIGFWALIYNQDVTDLLIGSMVALSQGASQWWILYDQQLQRAAQPLVNWREKHENILAHTHPITNVGVPYSFGSIHHPPNSNSRRWEQGYVSTCNVLTNAQIPYSVILDEDLGDAQYLSDHFQNLLMFDQYNVSEKQLTAVREFVRQGGTLIASGETSLYDEKGKKRQNFGLSELFGCSYQGEKTAMSRLMIPHKNPVTGDFIADLKHKASFILINQIKKEAHEIGVMKTMDGKEYSGIISQKFGKGNVVYLTGNPALSAFYTHYNENRISRGSLWTDERIPGYHQLISCLALYENSKAPMTVINGTSEIIAEIYRHEYKGMKGVQIRLVNLIGTRIKSGLVPVENTIDFPDVQKFLPDPKKPLSLKVKAPGTKKVYMISPDYDAIIDLPFQIEKEIVTFDLPKLYRFSLIYLSSGDDQEILSLYGGKRSKDVPKSIELIYSELPALAQPTKLPSITLFPELALWKGGSPKTFYKKEMSSFIYGEQSEVSELNIQFESPHSFVNPILEIGGMNDNAKVHATIEITLNNERIFLGKTRFAAEEWGILSFPLNKITLKETGNEIKIKIIGKGTRAGPPWFGVTYLRIKEDSITPTTIKN